MDVQPGAQSDLQPHDTFAIELVWDEDLDATAVASAPDPSGASPLRVGAAAGWLPAHHLALAAASGFMSSLLQRARAANIPILGYVSIAKLYVSSNADTPPHLTLRPCIVVSTQAHQAEMNALVAGALESSEVCRILQGRLVVNADVRSIDCRAEEGSP